MKTTAYIMTSLYLLFVSGCNYSQKTSADPEIITAQNFKTIVGVQWILEKMTIDGEAFELTGDTPFIQIEDDKKVTGFGSINRFFGSFEMTDDGQVSWPMPFGMTKMAGPPELMRQEDIFMKALLKTERFRQEGIRLYATSSDGTTELVFYVPVE